MIEIIADLKKQLERLDKEILAREKVEYQHTGVQLEFEKVKAYISYTISLRLGRKMLSDTIDALDV